MAKILLVEDHEEIWDFLSRRLQRRGHEVILAHDGEAGVDKARTSRPDRTASAAPGSVDAVGSITWGASTMTLYVKTFGGFAPSVDERTISYSPGGGGAMMKL